MTVQIDPSETLISWYTQSMQRAELPNVKGRALLMAGADGTLKFVDDATLGSIKKLWYRIQAFFGTGNFCLNKISQIAKKHIDLQKEGIQPAVQYLNDKIDTYNSRSIFRTRIQKITLSILKEPKNQPSTPSSKLGPNQTPPIPPSQINSELMKEKITAAAYIKQELSSLENYEQAAKTANKEMQEALQQFQDSGEESLLEKIASKGNDEKSALASAEEITHTITGLAKIENHFDIFPIMGDGHCLFRSVATALLLQITPSDLWVKIHSAVDSGFVPEITARPNGKNEQEIIRDLQNILDETPLHKEQLTAYLTVLKSLEKLQEKISKKLPLEEAVRSIMTNTSSSNSWTHLLRLLASGAWKHPSMGDKIDTLKYTANVALDQDLPVADIIEYLDNMEKMTHPQWGADAEIMGICAALQVNICSINLPSSGQQSDERIAANTLSGTQGSKGAEITGTHPDKIEDCIALLYLVFSGIHYDAAIRK